MTEVGWRLRVVHTTRVGYASRVRDSRNEVRMTPLTLASQTTLDSEVSVGAGVPVRMREDRWGTRVAVFGISEPHSVLWVRATSTVATRPPRPLPVAPDWPPLRLATGSGTLATFLAPTPLTSLDVTVDRAGDPHETAASIAALVGDTVRFTPGATEAGTSARQAWDRGQGVCQDIAHVTLALLRGVGLPARYVSGYLHADPSAVPGQTTVGQSHAWVEYWAGEWVPCDPTHRVAVGERHVVVARGRDYADVPPLTGTYRGAPAATLDVRVAVTRLPGSWSSS
jgi:transglutaminase-like putative cysteine protease